MSQMDTLSKGLESYLSGTGGTDHESGNADGNPDGSTGSGMGRRSSSTAEPGSNSSSTERMPSLQVLVLLTSWLSL